MKKNFALAFTLLGVLIAAGGCAERHRTADTGRTPQEIEDFIAELSGNAAATGTDTASAIQMAQDSNAVIYYAESNSAGTAAMGPMEAVADVDWDVFGLNVRNSQIDELRVFFVERPSIYGKDYALILYIKTGEQVIVQGYVNTAGQSSVAAASIEDDQFLVTFLVNGKEVYLNSLDTQDNKLQEAIKINITSYDDGVETEHGQFSTLVGYF